MNSAERSASLKRRESDNDIDGTFGDWLSDSGFSCVVGELPWRDNHKDLSCVPVGRYLAQWLWSNKHGCNLYHITGVPDRDDVEIHKGNLCGDVAKDRKSDVEGCQLPGATIAEFAAGARPGQKHAQLGVTGSGETLARLEADMRDDAGEQASFWLDIS